MADFLGTKHHELHFTVQEGLDCLHDLIYHLESFEQVLALPAWAQTGLRQAAWC